MKRFLLIALVLPAYFIVALPSHQATTRIVGGNKASPGQFPYEISLQLGGNHFCGGSIVAATKILTTAHCIYGMTTSAMTVVAGMTSLLQGGQTVKVSSTYPHPDFNPQTLSNDIAVLTLASPIIYDTYVQPIILRDSLVQPNENLTMCGWGLTTYPGSSFPQNLQWLNMTAIDLQRCATEMKNAGAITDSNVCTTSPTGQGPCKGDTGSPLTDTNGQLVGVSTWGISCARGYPDVFTAVSFYYEWILAAL